MTKDDLTWYHDEEYYEQPIIESDEDELYRDDCAERASDMNQENRGIW